MENVAAISANQGCCCCQAITLPPPGWWALRGLRTETGFLPSVPRPLHSPLPDCVRCVSIQSCPTLQPRGLQLSRLFCPWDYPGENGSGVLFPPPGALPDPRIEPPSPALQADSLPLQGNSGWGSTGPWSQRVRCRSKEFFQWAKLLHLPLHREVLNSLTWDVWFSLINSNLLITWSLFQKLLYILAPPYLLGAVSQSYLRCCVPALNPQFCLPNKT